ncbi:MAG: PepSY domain-containing protein [Bacillota bacterium]
MTDPQLFKRLKDSLEGSVPDVLDDILSQCEIRKGNVMEMNKTVNRKATNKSGVLRTMCAVAASLALVVGGSFGLGQYNIAHAVETVVTMDVNPSVALSANRNASVVAAEALNEDGEKVLEGLDLEGMKLETAAQKVAEAMIEDGYLSESANSVLVAVKNDDPDAAAALEKLLAAGIAEALKNEDINGAIISLQEDLDKQQEELAKKLNISEGKTALIQSILEKAPELSAEDLAGLNINDLCLIAEKWAGEFDGLTFSGMPSAQKFIGPERAISNTGAQADLSYTGSPNIDAQLGYQDGKFVYNVKMTADTSELSALVDAETGEVLKKIVTNTIGMAAEAAKAAAAAQTGNPDASSGTGLTQIPGVSEETGALINGAIGAIAGDSFNAGSIDVIIDQAYT